MDFVRQRPFFLNVIQLNYKAYKEMRFKVI